MIRTHRVSLALPVAVLAAVFFLAAPPAAQAAGDPSLACVQGVAGTMSSCIKKAAKSQVTCVKKTGGACASDDDSATKSIATATKKVRAKCKADADVADAGYGSFTRTQLGVHFGGSCVNHGIVIAERAFGIGTRGYQAADAETQGCLLAAAKEAGGFVGKVLKGVGKCVKALGVDCPVSEFDASELIAKSAAKIDKKCTDADTALGQTVEAYLGQAVEQALSAIQAPCDPINGNRCAFPYPNDYFTIPAAATDTGLQLNLGSQSLPRNGSQSAVDPTRFNEADGFSIGPMLLIGDASIDLTMTGAAPITDLAESLDPATPIAIFDAETGEQMLAWVERDQNGASAADQPIIIRVGRNLEDGKRYIVAMRNIKDSGGATIPANATFAAYRDGTSVASVPEELRRPHMEDVLSTLEGFGVTRSELYLAWDFTTQSSESVAGRSLAMRDDAFSILGADAPAFTVDLVTEPLDGNIFRRIDGTFQVPLYLTDGGIPGAALRRGLDGYPSNEGDFFTANYRCIIPYAATTGGAAPAVPARPSLYGHGLLGSHTEVTAGNVRAFSNEHNFVLCATDWTGFASDDATFVALTVVPNFSFFPNFIDRQHQGILNFQFLGRLMTHPDGFASDAAFQLGGDSVIDPSELFYDGNSQGGILGGVLAAFAQDIERFVLGVPGINYSTLLNRSVDFEPFYDLLQGAYPASTDQNLLLSLAQVMWDRTDPSGHINHVTSDPYAGTPAKKLLYHVAFGDHQVAPVTAEIAARSNGMSIHTPTLDGGKVVPEVTPYFDIPAILSYPFDGSAIVIWDSGNPAPPTGNIPPENIINTDPEWADLGPCAMGATGGDPHSCPRSNPNARLQKSEFLKAGGAVVDVCTGGPCFAP